MWSFDEPVKREGTSCIKYDLREEIFGVRDIIPMWVADMDFNTPDFITKALEKRLRHSIYGYSFRPAEYYESIINWQRKRHNWNTEKEWICFSPGIVPALNLCTLAFTEPGDTVIVQPPVYFPFFSAVKMHGRNLVFNKLSNQNGRWEMDLENLSESIDQRTRMIIISNPHNPVGRVWTVEELEKLADICLENDMVILSDEIHCDLVLPGHTHFPISCLSDTVARRTVTCIAPSKTFNLAGLSTSSVIIPDPGLRQSFNSLIEKLHIGAGNIFGTTASIAAYTEGHEWLSELIGYIESNIRYVVDYLNSKVPEIVPVLPEATYMIWLDCRKLGMTGKELQDFFVKSAGVGMNEGSSFGPGGEGFMRMNVGCQRETVVRALEKIGKAVAEIR